MTGILLRILLFAVIGGLIYLRRPPHLARLEEPVPRRGQGHPPARPPGARPPRRHHPPARQGRHLPSPDDERIASRSRPRRPLGLRRTDIRPAPALISPTGGAPMTKSERRSRRPRRDPRASSTATASRVWTQDFAAYETLLRPRRLHRRAGTASRSSGIFHPPRLGGHLGSASRSQFENEASASTDYAYETTIEDLQLRICGDMAWATFDQHLSNRR